jgi:hypothetical protein
MVDISGTSGSKRETAAALLSGRGLQQQAVDRQPPRDLQTAAQEFFKEIRIAAGRRINDDEPSSLFLQTNLDKLKSSMAGRYKDEKYFNRRLFATLRQCLKDYELKSDNSDFFLIKNTCSDQDYAVGFARELRPSLDPFPKEQHVTATDGTTSIGTRSHLRPDHSVCLFGRRKGGPWEAIDCFAKVELRTNKTSCIEFPRESKTLKIEQSETAEEILQDPLAHVILNNIGCILLYHARRGKLVKELPLAIVDCKELDMMKTDDDTFSKTKDQPEGVDDGADGKENGCDGEDQKAVIGDDYKDSVFPAVENRRQGELDNRFDEVDDLPLAQVLASNMPIFKRLGNNAKRSPDENAEQPDAKKSKKLERCRWVSAQLHVPEATGDRFYYSVKDFGRFHEADSVEQALSQFFDTMLSGLQIAAQVCDELAKKFFRLTPAVPASGQQLMVGKTHLKQVEFCASPIPGANLTKWGDNYPISQGELFKGKMDVSGILRQAHPKVVFLSNQVDGTVELDVLVKVSSTAVHSLLVNPADTFLALMEIRYSEEPKKIPDKVLNEIGSVLYGVVKTDVGLISIMADLSDECFVAVQPIDSKNGLFSLWNAFRKLVKNVLLPLAENVTVIHPDIRPGYDTTSNLLLKKGREGPTTMKLIDYESFVLFRDWVAPNTARYISKQDGKDAITFVWWQCVAMAYFWDAKISIKPTPGEESKMKIMKDILLGSKKGPAWLKALGAMAAGSVTVAEVEWTLTELAKVFPDLTLTC